MKYLADEMRKHLIAANVAQMPVKNKTYSDATKPICFVEHLGGAPAPDDEKVTTTIHLTNTGGLPQAYNEGFFSWRSVDVVIRSTSPQIAETVAQQIKDVISDKRAFIMGTLRIETVQLYRELGRIPSNDPEKGYIFVMGYMFNVRRASLES